MKNVIPPYIAEIHRNKSMPLTTTMKATIPIGTAAQTGITFENRTDYNNRNILGIALRVNAVGGTKTGKNGNRLIEMGWAENSFLEIRNGSDVILDQICLDQLIPPAGESYVKVWIPAFTPSTSKFTFSGALVDPLYARDIEVTFFHSEL